MSSCCCHPGKAGVLPLAIAMPRDAEAALEVNRSTRVVTNFDAVMSFGISSNFRSTCIKPCMSMEGVVAWIARGAEVQAGMDSTALQHPPSGQRARKADKPNRKQKRGMMDSPSYFFGDHLPVQRLGRGYRWRTEFPQMPRNAWKRQQQNSKPCHRKPEGRLHQQDAPVRRQQTESRPEPKDGVESHGEAATPQEKPGLHRESWRAQLHRMRQALHTSP